MLLTLISCTLLSACGGGDGGNPAASAFAPQTAATMPPVDTVSIEPVTYYANSGVTSASEAAPASFASTQVAPTLLAASAVRAADAGDEIVAGSASSTSALVMPPRQTASQAPTGGTITTVAVQNTGLVQMQVPLTFGHVFAAGDVPAGYTVAARLADGTALPMQVDVKATHADGSLRHAVLTAILPRLLLLQVEHITLLKTAGGTALTARPPQPATLLDSGFSASVNVTVNGQTYSFSPAAALRSGAYTTWLSGALVQEWVVTAPLKTAASVDHPHLTARMSVRWYPGVSKKARVEVVVENTKTFAAGTQNFTYDTDVKVGGRTVYSAAGLTHYNHARWRKLFWWDTLSEPAVHVRHNTAYLIASKAVPNYDQRVVVSPVVLASYAAPASLSKFGVMKIGSITDYMPTSGGRSDIGPLPAWTVSYLLSMDKRAKDLMLGIADGSGTWSIHFRDEKTGYPIRLDNAVNRLITTHGNFNHMGPLPVPRCAGGDWSLCKTPYTADSAHQPSLTYVPYLVTGDHFYLEELQFWAAVNSLGTDPARRSFELGHVRFDQIRGQAWSLRTLGQVAYITPDASPMKPYWTTQLNNNLEFYHEAFVVANPNELGAYESLGGKLFVSPNGSPWQDDFLTWSFGYINELGFTKAKPIVDWKAKYAVGRMTAPGFCYTEGASYFLQLRPTPEAPVYKTFAELYQGHFGSGERLVDDENIKLVHPKGKSYFDQQCGSQAQADWRSAAGRYKWTKGRMVGYSNSTAGYPSNMQPALAIAAATNIPNAQLAWQRFSERSVKPDYSMSPEWAIIPRK